MTTLYPLCKSFTNLVHKSCFVILTFSISRYSGTHRKLWPVYGEYVYVPPQRWIHSLEHGAIVLLYHPCANLNQVSFFLSFLRIRKKNDQTTKIPLSAGCRKRSDNEMSVSSHHYRLWSARTGTTICSGFVGSEYGIFSRRSIGNRQFYSLVRPTRTGKNFQRRTVQSDVNWAIENCNISGW